MPELLIECLNVIEDYEERADFEKFYLKYRRFMTAIAGKYLSDANYIDDAVSEAFLYIANNFKKLSKLKKNELEAYITVMIRNIACDIYNKKEKVIDYDDLTDIPSGDTNEEIFEKYSFESLINAIKSLPAIYRDVIYLCYIKELTSHEAAKVLQIKDATVRKRIERGKEILREKLKELGIYV